VRSDGVGGRDFWGTGDSIIKGSVPVVSAGSGMIICASIQVGGLLSCRERESVQDPVFGEFHRWGS